MSLVNSFLRSQRERSQRAVTTADLVFGPQIQTQLGDPDFSLGTTPDSQAQFPAAAAEDRLFTNQRFAQNRSLEARAAGVDLAQPQFAPLTDTAGGFAERALTLGESLIGWIDGPRQAINLAFQDIYGGDAEPGLEDPSFGDYFDIFWGGLEDDEEEFKRKTGLNPVSGSTTLDMMGFPLQETLPGRIIRGGAHFLLDVAFDPITYVTFGLSGLGKKVAARWGGEFAEDIVQNLIPRFMNNTLPEYALTLPKGSYTRELAMKMDDIGFDFVKQLGKIEEKHGIDFLDRMVKDLEKYLSKAVDPDNAFMELALRQRIGKDVVTPLVGRDFAAIPKNALEELPKAWMRGGMRIGVPFTERSLRTGLMVPGTRGLGRKLIGKPVRDQAQRLRKFSDKFSSLADVVENTSNVLDADRALLRALSTGRIEPWQYNIARAGRDTVVSTAHKAEIAAGLNLVFKELKTIASGLPGETPESAFRQVIQRLEKVNTDDVALKQWDEFLGIEDADAALGPNPYKIDPDLDAKIDEIAGIVQDVIDDHAQALSQLDPNVRKDWVDGTLPHLLSPEGNKIMNNIADITGIPDDGEAGSQLLGMFQTAVSNGGVLENKIGASATARGGIGVGKVTVHRLMDDGALMINKEGLAVIEENVVRRTLVDGVVDPGAITQARLSIPELNDLLKPEVLKLAKEGKITLPKNWDGKLLNENPLVI